MILIAAVDKDWAIGNKGDLLVSLPEDQRGVFRKYTLDKTVIYGRKTLQTFKDEKLLPRRANIILTRNNSYYKEGATILHSISEAREYESSHPDEEIYVIGGAEVYKSMESICSKAIITFINHSFLEKDAFFPNLDSSPEWTLDLEEPLIVSEKGYSFNVRHYSRK